MSISMEAQELIKLVAICCLAVFLLNLSPTIERNKEKLARLKRVKMRKYKAWRKSKRRGKI